MNRENLLSAPLIDHIGILVPDLEAAIVRWSQTTGYTFSPIARYRTHHYIDASQPDPHFHDARIAFSKEGSPRIELMEATGTGTHGSDQLGIHHFGFIGVQDAEGRATELKDLGVAVDGCALDDDGRILLFFTEKSALDGIRLEYVSTLPGPTVADDGSPLWRDPATGRNSFWGPPRLDQD
jgi:hypothetical protein